MSQWKVTPSAAYTVSPDTSIADCVRVMRDRGFGSILVSDLNHELVGIFTERDLLKWVDEIQHGGHWNKAISVLMSKPVYTLSIDDLDRAAEVMIQHNIRHIPIVHHDEASGKMLAGIVSMRDLFREIVNLKQNPEVSKRQLRAGMIAQNEGMRLLLRKICARQGNLIVGTLSIVDETKALLTQMDNLDYLFLDLDGVETKAWVALLKELNALTKQPEVLLLYDPAKHSEAELELLTKLSLSERFSAYMKPLNIFTILNKIS